MFVSDLCLVALAVVDAAERAGCRRCTYLCPCLNCFVAFKLSSEVSAMHVGVANIFHSEQE